MTASDDRRAEPGGLNRPPSHTLGIGLMCKPPIPGVSKTRLAAVLGAERAALLAGAFLADSASLARQLATREHAALTGFYTPGDAGAAMAVLLPGWALQPQSGGDLGARMGDAVARIFAAGADRALLLGTDAPTLPPAPSARPGCCASPTPSSARRIGTGATPCHDRVR